MIKYLPNHSLLHWGELKTKILFRYYCFIWHPANEINYNPFQEKRMKSPKI